MSMSVEASLAPSKAVQSGEYLSHNTTGLTIYNRFLRRQIAIVSGFAEWAELGIEYTKFITSPHYKGHTLPRPQAPRSIIAVPGFMADNFSLLASANYFARLGHYPRFALTGRNIMQMNQLEEVQNAYIQTAQSTNDSVVGIGQSAGGTFALLGAIRANELYHEGKLPSLKKPPVANVYTLGSPIAAASFEEIYENAPNLAFKVRNLAEVCMQSDPRKDEMLTMRRYFYEQIPSDLRVISYRSLNDRIVPSAYTQRGDVEVVNIKSPHTGMGYDIDTLLNIGTDLLEQERENKFFS